MNTQDPTAASNDTPDDSEDLLAESTRCLSDAYTARARIRLDRGEYDPALADLNDAVRLAPDNTEALQLRDAVEQRRGHVDRAEPILGQAERLEPATNGGRPVQTRFQAGYRVMARYSVEDDGTDDHLTHSRSPQKAVVMRSSTRVICAAKNPSLSGSSFTTPTGLAANSSTRS
jgi:tetratricopeptide (TPR) repeat protein